MFYFTRLAITVTTTIALNDNVANTARAGITTPFSDVLGDTSPLEEDELAGD